MGDRVILHSDINCCYASIEHLHHPELAGKPLAVGGDPEARHGIVLTADYIAKKYGVKTGPTLHEAEGIPDLIVEVTSLLAEALVEENVVACSVTGFSLFLCPF